MGRIVLEGSRGRVSIILNAVRLGPDTLVYITGGDAHIGAAAVGTFTGGLASSSVITVPSHRDDRVAKDAAEKLSKSLRSNVVVVAGIHYDNMTPDEITSAIRICEELIVELVEKLCKKE
ncbi:hypothetical protein CUJ83_11195 [Methanocella sp. CWC-04]|uniref:Prenylated flavin chaperone LpdD-like domain-containing protein n=1 Tax=Methanooceanicella nereidis TaxID=2052831 RepID=A0AAP2RDG1_9EURY|nr:hypothetical protein [Methanocella sp. CWC-04]MCD1295564.1 hypothetical protein [Methanocella sp. CWC-04]